MVAVAFNLSSQKAEAGRSLIQGQPGLLRELRASTDKSEIFFLRGVQYILKKKKERLEFEGFFLSIRCSYILKQTLLLIIYLLSFYLFNLLTICFALFNCNCVKYILHCFLSISFLPVP